MKPLIQLEKELGIEIAEDRATYNIARSRLNKMAAIFKKHNISYSKKADLDDDEAEYELSGSKKDLEAFFKGGGMKLKDHLI